VDPDLLPERFRKKFVVSTEHFHNGTPCWEWQYNLVNGYGQHHVNIRRIDREAGRRQKAVLAHRFAYEFLVGPIPGGLTLDHLCRNRACVNPAHLEPVTHRVNILRGVGLAANNARKTHCRHGHLLAGDNVRLTATGERVCRTCRRAYSVEFYRKNRDTYLAINHTERKREYKRNRARAYRARKKAELATQP
jgi:hypothetical protein